MTNFKQICYIKTDYHTKAPLIKEAVTQSGKNVCNGQITWQDGKNMEGKTKYQFIHFFSSKEEVIKTLLANKDKALEIEGWLKIDREEAIKDGVKFWKIKPEIHVIRASVYAKEAVQDYYNN